MHAGSHALLRCLRLVRAADVPRWLTVLSCACRHLLHAHALLARFTPTIAAGACGYSSSMRRAHSLLEHPCTSMLPESSSNHDWDGATTDGKVGGVRTVGASASGLCPPKSHLVVSVSRASWPITIMMEASSLRLPVPRRFTHSLRLTGRRASPRWSVAEPWRFTPGPRGTSAQAGSGSRRRRRASHTVTVSRSVTHRPHWQCQSPSASASALPVTLSGTVQCGSHDDSLPVPVHSGCSASLPVSGSESESAFTASGKFHYYHDDRS